MHTDSEVSLYFTPGCYGAVGVVTMGTSPVLDDGFTVDDAVLGVGLKPRVCSTNQLAVKIIQNVQYNKTVL